MITDQKGYKYEVRASSVNKTPTLSNSTGQPSDAPPGQTFLTINVQVKNPLTDRAEPFDLANHDGTEFVLHFPLTSLAAFGVRDAGQGCSGLQPTTDCAVFTKVTSMSPADNLLGPVELPPAGQPPELVQLTFGDGAVPESAPTDQLTLFVEFSGICGGPCNFPPPVPIPLAR